MSFTADAALVVHALAAYESRCTARTGAVLRQRPIADVMRDLDFPGLIAEGGLTGGRLGEFLADYLAECSHLRHPRHMGHQVSVPNQAGALAALIDAFTNNPMAIYEMGPAAATAEQAVLQWMSAKVGWNGDGVLTHGGSAANLTALAAARARIAPNAWADGNPADLVVVAPAASHYSVMRAAGILGLGSRAVLSAPSDQSGRMDADLLGPFLDQIHADGRRVMAVAANAGATALGLYDPLRAIAEICRERGIWLHVDGAHGAAALISPNLRGRMDGVELADSLVWDAHKMLRVPNVCAALLVRDGGELDRAFQQDASYLFHDKDRPGPDSIHRTIECTKAGLGLKAFFTLAHQGEGAIAQYVESRFALARAAAQYLDGVAGFQVAAPPQSNIVCFRPDCSDDQMTQLRRDLIAKGDFFVSGVEFQGKRWLRLAFMNPETDLDDVAALARAVHIVCGQ
jgi:L-2,4-diaminobutyrate decarboxylase